VGINSCPGSCRFRCVVNAARFEKTIATPSKATRSYILQADANSEAEISTHDAGNPVIHGPHWDWFLQNLLSLSDSPRCRLVVKSGTPYNSGDLYAAVGIQSAE
jgi:hypothetical protein